MKSETVLERILEAHVGVCLWSKLKKFERNLPIKNFEYRSAGLPVLTCDFGNLRRYIDESEAGICIDPEKYDEFEDAVHRLFDTKKREEMGSRGIAWSLANTFEKEAEPYIFEVARLSGVSGGDGVRPP